MIVSISRILLFVVNDKWCTLLLFVNVLYT